MCGFAVYTGGDKMTRLKAVSEFQKIKYRGPDNSHYADFADKGWMGFHRLKIMDVSDDGNQPMGYDNIFLVANGEVYNYPQLLEDYQDKHDFQSTSDCEVMIPMYQELGIYENTIIILQKLHYQAELFQDNNNITDSWSG